MLEMCVGVNIIAVDSDSGSGKGLDFTEWGMLIELCACEMIVR